MNNNSDNFFFGFNQKDIETSIVTRFESIVHKYPQNIAIKINGDEITYQELNQKANQIARLIIKKNEDGNLFV